MKLTVDAKNFVESISWVTKNYDSKDDKAYVALVVSEDGESYLSHANQTSYIKGRLPLVSVDFTGDSENEAGLALEGKFLQRLASALGTATGTVELSKSLNKPKTSLDVKSSHGKFTIPLVDSTIAPAPEMTNLGEVDDNEYFDSIQRLAKLCDAVNAGYLPVLGTVDLKLDAEEGKLSMMATDRYALGEIVVDFTPDAAASEILEDLSNLLLPHENAQLVSPSKGLSTSITLVYEEEGKKFGYSFADGRVALFSLSNTSPLAYSDLKKAASSKTKSSMTVSTNDLKKAIGIVSSLAWEEDSVWLDISEDGTLVVSDSNQTNTLAVDSENAVTDSALRVKFIRPVINEAFSPVSTGKMNLKWADASNAFILEPVLDDGSAVENVFVLASPSPE
jgi:DNA polymerase III sliding clamp (beta) subunit (PCNA family)